MCGLAGIFQISGSKLTITPDLLKPMQTCMIHRGPDDGGEFISSDKSVGLTHRRLSIIDLSTSARQPMATADEKYWIVFNGEIYNHAALRRELIEKGRPFKTDHSDTEVILQGYAEWGKEVLSRLHGMFSIALWDSEKKEIWLVRDRLGVKPLYYAMYQGALVFASEIKALLTLPEFPRAMNMQAFHDFLTFLVAPAPQTLFEGIQKLPAGHTLTVNQRGTQTLQRYWNPFAATSAWSSLSESEASNAILGSLRESIRLRMVSDVNFGVFLSGGIDSSANTALMAELMDRPVDTFTIGYKNESAFNELDIAKKVAAQFNTNHHETLIDESDFLNFLPKLIYHQDEPIADPVCVPVYYVSKLARDNGTIVCQVGEGSDELFCGYPAWLDTLQNQKWAHRFQALPGFLRKGMFQLGQKGMAPFWRGQRHLDLLRRAAYNEPLFWGGAEAFQETHKDRLLSLDVQNQLKGYSSFQKIESYYQDFLNDAPAGADPLHWMSYLDLRLRLPELLLMRVDKMTMATGVESRVPFLDHQFVELAMSLPQSLKIKNNTPKYLLKKAVSSILPDEVVHRKKQGFGVPIEEWFLGKIRGWTDQKLRDFTRRSYLFDQTQMNDFIERGHPRLKWFLLNFVLWHEMWIENKPLEMPTLVKRG